MLTKIDDEVYFDLNFRSDFSTVGEIDVLSKASQRAIKDQSHDNFKFFEDPFGEDEFNPAETLQKQLEKDPLPLIEHESTDDDKYPHLTAQLTPMIELDSDLNISIGSNKNQAVPATKEVEMRNAPVCNNKKKLTEFGYLLQRKGFRMMRKYYKDKFESFAKSFDYKKRVKSITPGEINQMMAQFIHTEFNSLLSVFSNSEIAQLLEALK